MGFLTRDWRVVEGSASLYNVILLYGDQSMKSEFIQTVSKPHLHQQEAGGLCKEKGC